MVITGSSVAVRCGRRLLAWPRTPAVFGPLAGRPSARAGPPGRLRPPAGRAEPQRPAMTPAAWPRGPRDPPRPARNRIVPSVRGQGRLPWGRGSHGLVGGCADLVGICQGLIPLDFSEILDI